MRREVEGVWGDQDNDDYEKVKIKLHDARTLQTSHCPAQQSTM